MTEQSGADTWETQQGDGYLTTSTNEDGKLRGYPMVLTSRPTGTRKGQTVHFKWNASSALTYPDTANLASADAYLHIGDMLVPWETSVTPLI